MPARISMLVLARLLSAVMLYAACTSVATAADEDKTRFFQATFENDLFFDTDRYYTDGVQFMWGKRGGQPDFLSRPLERFLCGTEKCPDERRLLYTHKIGQLMFTPKDITIAAPQPNDEPWSGYLYYEAASLFIDVDPTITRTIGYQVGVVGSWALAEQTQKFIHKTFSGRDPNGWDNQLHNEPGLMVTYTFEKLLLRPQRKLAEGALWVSGGGAAGNVMTYGSIGAKAAFGRNLPIQISPSQIGPKSLPMTEQASQQGAEQAPLKMFSAQADGANVPGMRNDYASCLRWFASCYAFVSVEGRAVARNIFLDGNTFQNNSGNVEKKNFVYDVVAGFRFRFGNEAGFMDGWYLDFSRTRRSSEFSSPAGDGGIQRFAAITLGREY